MLEISSNTLKTAKAIKLTGPTGVEVVVDLDNMQLSEDQSIALDNLLKSGSLDTLSEDERKSIADMKALVYVDERNALIVRFDCTWVRID